jgi:hypothetical protein
MQPQTIENRVNRLEGRVTELEKAPERVTAIESQIVQLRTEMGVEFSAVLEEIRAGDEETRRVFGEGIEDTRRTLGEGIEDTRRTLGERIEDTRRTLGERIEDTRRTLGEQIVETRGVLGDQIVETRRVLGEQILETDRKLNERIEESRRYMRVLHEDVIGRLATIQEVQSAARRDERKDD